MDLGQIEGVDGKQCPGTEGSESVEWKRSLGTQHEVLS